METAYDMLASLARYLFVLIMLFIIAASAVLSAREGRMMRRAKRIARTNIRCIRIIEPNELMGRRFYINGECTIGSGDHDDIVIGSCGLSRAHARLFDHKGTVCISVKRKRFFLINETRQHSRTVELEPGDRVRIMDAEFVCIGAGGEEEGNAQI